MFKIWGKVQSPVGSGIPITVTCPGYFDISEGDFVTVTGTLSTSTPPTINCTPDMITKIRDAALE